LLLSRLQQPPCPQSLQEGRNQGWPNLFAFLLTCRIRQFV
jgi:hypothetical protein